MGKSGKKLKSDRINTLRKQYDAFLEEDKRRKDRNEYILGRLDKMRYVTSVMPLRHKSNVITIDSQKPVVGNRSRYIPDNLQTNGIHLIPQTQNNLQLDVPSKFFDETPMIQEISKRYILIPRSRPSDYVEENNPQFKDSPEWKSKYDILEQLKINDTEESAIKRDLGVTNENAVKISKCKESFKHNNSLNDDYNFEIPTKCDNEEILLNSEGILPEKDIVKNKTPKEQNHGSYNIIDRYEVNSNGNGNTNTIHTSNKNEEYSPQNIVESKIKMEPVEHSLSSNVIGDPSVLDACVNNTLETYIKDDSILKASEISNTVEEKKSLNTEHIPSQDEYHSQAFDIAEYGQTLIEEENIRDVEKVVLDENNTNQIEMMNPTDLVTEIKFEAPIEQVEHPENPENQNGAKTIQECLPDEHIQLQDGSNNLKADENIQDQCDSDVMDHIDPQNHIIPEKPEVPAIESEIEAFDAEQREMFYSENTEENYGYNQEGEAAHNYEYSIQDPNYQQSEEYAYYKGDATDQNYPTEINEHEETSQPYDQTYEEQYAKYEEQQHYEPQQVDNQPLQQYDQQQHGYDQQPDVYGQQSVAYDQTQQQQEFNQLQYQEEKYDTRPEVEEQLDQEDGLAETQNEDKNAESQVKEMQPGQKAAIQKVT